MNSGASIKDFVTVSVIGKGTYAKVLLVRYLKDNQLYAMKVLKKKYIL
jgi:protein-serine/threonine kinase